MNLNDMRLPVPFNTKQEIAQPGDIPLVAGEESLRRWILRVITTETGDLLHRPEFGVGVGTYVDKPILSAASAIANKIRIQVGRDRRVKTVSVQAGQAQGYPHKLDILVEILTTDNTQLGVETRIEIGI